jgi:hypothetical protein
MMWLQFLRLIVGGTVMVVAASPTPTATSGSSGVVPTDWRTYENRSLGIALRYPTPMVSHERPDTHLEGYIPQPAPDVQISLPVSFDETHISAADVVVETGTHLQCLSNFGDSDTQILAGRTFRHSVNSDGASGNVIRWEEFCGTYRSKVFVIKTVMQTYKFESEDTPEFIETVERHQREVESLLLRVLRTLALTDLMPGAAK